MILVLIRLCTRIGKGGSEWGSLNRRAEEWMGSRVFLCLCLVGGHLSFGEKFMGDVHTIHKKLILII